MLMSSKFFVCMPVYNAGKYLSTAIDSVLTASIGFDVTLILVNDGSLDNSPRICEQYAKENKNIIYITQENKGQYEARQTAVEWAQSHYDSINNAYICFVDADDMVVENYFSTIQEELDSDSSIDIVVFGFDFISEDGKLIVNNSQYHVGRVPDRNDLYEVVLGNEKSNYYSLWNKATSIALFDKMRCSLSFAKDMRYGEDAVESVTLYSRSKCVSFLSEKLYLYRRNPNSVTRKLNPIQYLLDWVDGTSYIEKQILVGGGRLEFLKKYYKQQQLQLVLRLWFVFSSKQKKEAQQTAFDKVVSSEIVHTIQSFSKSITVSALMKGDYRKAQIYAFLCFLRWRFISLNKRLFIKIFSGQRK